MNKVKTEVKRGRGRPNQVKALITKHSLQFQNKDDKSMVIYLLEKTDIRSKMKPASDEIVKRNLYVSVRNARAESLAQNKKVEFKGKVIGGVLKKKWIHNQPKAAKPTQISPAQVGV